LLSQVVQVVDVAGTAMAVAVAVALVGMYIPQQLLQVLGYTV
jgi:hypothetical protein